jgi:hypothetical protein
MKKTIKQYIVDRQRKMATLGNFNYIRLLREDYPNMPIIESTKAIIQKIKKESN